MALQDRKPDAVVLNEKDNAGTSLRPLQPGETVFTKTATGSISVQVQEGIPPNHKFAIRDVSMGEHIIKFGEIIGVATRNITIGAHVHTQNLKSLHGRVQESTSTTSTPNRAD